MKASAKTLMTPYRKGDIKTLDQAIKMINFLTDTVEELNRRSTDQARYIIQYDLAGMNEQIVSAANEVDFTIPVVLNFNPQPYGDTGLSWDAFSLIYDGTRYEFAADNSDECHLFFFGPTKNLIKTSALASGPGLKLFPLGHRIGDYAVPGMIVPALYGAYILADSISADKLSSNFVYAQTVNCGGITGSAGSFAGSGFYADADGNVYIGGGNVTLGPDVVISYSQVSNTPSSLDDIQSGANAEIDTAQSTANNAASAASSAVSTANTANDNASDALSAAALAAAAAAAAQGDATAANTLLSSLTYDDSGTTKISGSMVQSGAVVAGSVVSSWVYAGSVSADQITAGSLSADRISGGTINGNNVAVTNLSASNISTGTLTVGTVVIDGLSTGSGTGGVDITDGDVSVASLAGAVFPACVSSSYNNSAGYVVNNNTQVLAIVNCNSNIALDDEDNPYDYIFDIKTTFSGTTTNETDLYLGICYRYGTSGGWTILKAVTPKPANAYDDFAKEVTATMILPPKDSSGNYLYIGACIMSISSKTMTVYEASIIVTAYPVNPDSSMLTSNSSTTGNVTSSVLTSGQDIYVNIP